MGNDNEDDGLSEPRRREVFRALVETQDREPDVQRSRQFVAEQFGISEARLKRIEREGLDGKWPPL